MPVFRVMNFRVMKKSVSVPGGGPGCVMSKGCVLNLSEAGVRLADTDNSMPRTGVFTLRNSARDVSRCPGFEFEDLIVDELEPGAVFIEPSKAGARQLGLRAKRFISRRGIKTGDFNFGATTMSMGQDLDLFFAAPAVPSDLLALSAIHDWRKRSRVAVCYLQELWISEFDKQLAGVADILREFDHVFVGLYHTAEALSQRLGMQVDYLPLGIDAELWNPYTGVPRPRSIDVCAIGNMDPVTHDALWDWAEKSGRYYSFTTTAAANLAVPHKVHRQNLAQTLQRSKFFLTYMAKRAVTMQRGAQVEFGPRYFEGAGAGAIQLGDEVKTNPAYLEHMNWEGAVIDAPFSSADLPDLIESLDRDAGWIEDLRRRNVASCLRAHDHLYRWDMVLKAAGFEETPAAATRRARLKDQADQLENPSAVPLKQKKKTRG